MYPHTMFEQDFFEMYKEVQRQEKLDPKYKNESKMGTDIFYLFGEDVLPNIKNDDWVYESAKVFAKDYAEEYFTTLRLMNSVDNIQKRLTKMRSEIKELVREAMKSGLISGSVKLVKPSDFTKIVDIDELPGNLPQKAANLYNDALDLENMYVHTGSQATQALYEKGLPRIFFVVKRALKRQFGFAKTSGDNQLQEPHQYINWCKQHLDNQHILSRFLVSNREYYKIVRNVDSHYSGPKWLPESNQIYLPDKDNQMTVHIDKFSQLYRYLMYFCEIGCRGILAIFSKIEQGSISNHIKNEYIRMYDYPKLKHQLQNYPT